jgi:hypothetical protein
MDPKNIIFGKSGHFWQKRRPTGVLANGSSVAPAIIFDFAGTVDVSTVCPTSFHAVAGVRTSDVSMVCTASIFAVAAHTSGDGSEV